MLKRISRLRGRSWAELRFRGWQALASRGERLRLALGAGPEFGAHSLRPEELLSQVSQVFARLGEGQRPVDVAQGLSRSDPSGIEALRSRVAQMGVGQVQVLGLPPFFIGMTPDWHCDNATGLIAPRRHWSQIPFLDAKVVGDHKSLWEVNRHQYLLAPALIWLLDGSDTEFKMIQRHLASWLRENPPTVGVNWASSLEVAYRAITWIWLLWFLQDAPWDTQVLHELTGALDYSGAHIERYLSLYFSPNTHLTGEALALFYLGIVLPPSTRTTRWLKQGASILETWLPRQVHSDGVYNEQAALYQRYTAEIYLHYARLACASGRVVSPRVNLALHGLFDVLRSMASSDSKLPLLGDDDGGQLFPLDQRSPEIIGGVLLAGATALARPDLVPRGVSFPAISYALCGVEATRAMEVLAAQNGEPTWCDRYFPVGGVAVLRDGWSERASVAVIDAGPHGVANCGHAHADALSMSLSLGSVPLFVDRGTLTYIGTERNQFRSTCSHNTLEFDGTSAVTPRGRFHWEAIPEAPNGTMRCYGDLTVFAGEAAGHVDTTLPSTHRRVVAHRKSGAWLVVDQGWREGVHSAVVRWQLAAGLKASVREGIWIVTDQTGTCLAAIDCLGARSCIQTVRDTSVRYGDRRSAMVIEATAGEEVRVVTVVVAADGGEQPNIRLRQESQTTVAEWLDAHGPQQVWVPDSPARSFTIPGFPEVRAQAIWRSDLLLAIGARQLTADGGQELVVRGEKTASSDVVASRSGTQWAILPGIASPDMT